ncbi:transcriptional regulator [Streptococcus varani]|uniref:Transcriptional regulator n=1 Tax=Streptococcus varani TaxID=1608583 RepID=A0A0E3WEI7_9STRE|nr:sugar-binding transcriptional regulator [Streptococcus varani]CQR23749.1 transcriptional regulator [Streptococcus varani]
MENYTEKDYVKVAVMYYDEGMTQAEIARKLGVSRSLISKMLIDAREAKIVEIFINSQSVFTTKLERELEQRFDLQDVVVVDTVGLTPTETKRKLSRIAANYLEAHLRKNPDIKRIGISWGETLRQLVNYLPYVNHPNFHIYPLIGGMGNEHFYLHSNQLVQTMAQKMRGTAHYLYVPAMVSSIALKKELELDSTISRVLEEGKTVDVGLFGIASLEENSTMTKTGYISLEEAKQFKEKLGVIGDINSQFFDQDGNSILGINEHVMGVSLDAVKGIPTKIVTAYGMAKASAIRVGLKNKMANILITTDETAQAILSE